MNYITLVKGDDTNWNGINFITINLTSEVLNLSEFKAVFILGEITKHFNDIAEGKIELNFNAKETSSLPASCYGKLRLIDKLGRIATLESLIPFRVLPVVHNNAIATEQYTLNFDVTQSGETILNVDIKAEFGVTVEVGTTTTLPPGSDATVTNSGTINHLILDFGIPGSDHYDDTEIREEIARKQDTLVSGENIKTINNQSILGSGNIEIETPDALVYRGSDTPEEGVLIWIDTSDEPTVRTQYVTKDGKSFITSDNKIFIVKEI